MNKLTWLLATASLGVVTVAGCGDDTPSLECGANTTMTDGVCVGDTGTNTTCGAGTIAMGTECVPDGSVICETGTTLDMASGTCVADITGCGTGTIVVDGVCTDPADVTADVTEATEPNDLGPDGTPGMITLPMVGESITISGCIEPTTDMAGNAVIDDDGYIFEAAGPTLLDITVDGFNGVAGAFQLATGDAELVNAGFNRFGINLANDMSQRQVFLPKAANYGITLTDSRSLFFGEAAGGPGACYLATIRNVALPMPTAITVDTQLDGTFGSDTQFLRFTPATDGAIATSSTVSSNESAMVDTVLMVNGQYRGSSAGLGGRDFGDPAANVAGDLNTADMVTYVVDPVINLALNPVNFSHLVSEIGSTAIPTDGTTVAFPTPGDADDEFLDHYPTFTVANDGDVVFLDLDISNFSTDVTWGILDSSLNPISAIEIGGSGANAGHYQFAQAGLYYIDIRDDSGSVVDPYNFVGTQIDHTPTPLVVDTPIVAGTFGDDKAAFYSVTPGLFEWWNITGTPTNFDGPMNFNVFNLGQPGKLGDNVAPLQTLGLVGDDNVQTLNNSAPLLMMVNDDGPAAAPTATYDFSVANVAFTDLGVVEAATPATDTVTAAPANTYYRAAGVDGNTFTVIVSGANGFDPVLVIFTDDGETVIDANPGANTSELNFTAVLNGAVTFGVRDAADSGGDFTVDVTLAQTLNMTSAPGLAFDDATPVSDTITVGACTVGLVNVDVNISHTWIGDVTMTLTSPAATPVVLHARSGGSSDDIIGNYPLDFAPDEDLSTFVGEDGMGDWVLDLTDSASGDDGTFNSWGLNLVCQ